MILLSQQSIIRHLGKQILYVICLTGQVAVLLLAPLAQDLHEVRVHGEHLEALRLLQQGANNTDGVFRKDHAP